MKNQIYIGPYRYSERELSQIIRRKMIQKSEKSSKLYTRKMKHTIKFD